MSARFSAAQKLEWSFEVQLRAQIFIRDFMGVFCCHALSIEKQYSLGNSHHE
jgi:lysylphosphatidylglycerol synthetase-like protein (DUF2156 family)